jgi:hypothetical protein
MGIALICTFAVTLPIVIMWTRGIDKMKDEHPDYTGDDLFENFDYTDKQKKKKENE